MKKANRPNEAFAATVRLVIAKDRTTEEITKLIDVNERQVRIYFQLLEEEGLVERRDDVDANGPGRPHVVWHWIGDAIERHPYRAEGACA